MDTCEEYSAEFVRRAAADILAVRPAYAELIGFYASIFSAQEESRLRVRLEPILLPPDLVRIKLKDKFPLIQVAAMRFDPEASATLFAELCRIAVERGSDLAAAAEALLRRSPPMGPLFQGFLEADEARLTQAADTCQVGARTLSFFIYHSLRPSLCRCSQGLSGFLAGAPVWESGYCPICGSAPALAWLGAEGERSLYCSFCWHRWRLNRVVCPFCSTGDPGRLSFLYSDEEKEYRIEVCDACRKYIKAVDSRNLARPAYPPLEQIASLHLDLKASEGGYETGLPARPPV